MKKNAPIAPILHKKVGRYPKFSLFVQGHPGQNHFYTPELVLLSTDSSGLSSQMWPCQHFTVGVLGRRARRRGKAREGAGTGGSTNSMILPSLAFLSQLSPPFELFALGKLFGISVLRGLDGARAKDENLFIQVLERPAECQSLSWACGHRATIPTASALVEIAWWTQGT